MQPDWCEENEVHHLEEVCEFLRYMNRTLHLKSFDSFDTNQFLQGRYLLNILHNVKTRQNKNVRHL